MNQEIVNKPAIQFFNKLDEIGNNANIGIRGLLRENKKSGNKMLPQ